MSLWMANLFGLRKRRFELPLFVSKRDRELARPAGKLADSLSGPKRKLIRIRFRSPNNEYPRTFQSLETIQPATSNDWKTWSDGVPAVTVMTGTSSLHTLQTHEYMR